MPAGSVTKPRKRGWWARFRDGMRTLNGYRDMASDPYLQEKLLWRGAKYAVGSYRTKREAEIPDEVRGQSRYARVSYLPETTRPATIGDAVYEPALSSKKTAVYREGDRYHVGLRGTVLGAEDLISDMGIVNGSFDKNHTRVRETLDLLKTIGATPENTTMYGHSLGGAIATAASAETGIRSVNFNTGASPVRFSSNRHAHHHLIDGDFLSNSAIGNVPGGQVTVYTPRNPNKTAHTIDQFAYSDDE